ncbi:MAG: prolyl oligopeptidase family serine peptidase [Myxococcota bacterium]
MLTMLSIGTVFAAPYTGVGASSVDPEVVAKYLPPPLAPDVERRVQLAMDVRPAISGPMTPDGRRMFFTWAITGSSQVWRLDGPNTVPVQLTGGDQTTSVVGITRDGAQLLVSRDTGGTENYGIYLQSVDGGPLRPVFADPKFRASVQQISTDGHSVLYVANDREPTSTAVYRYDLAAGTSELVYGEPGLWNVADERFEGETRIVLLSRDTGSETNEIWELDTASRKATPLLGVGEHEQYAAQYGRTPGELLVVTNARSDLRRLYTWTATNKKRTKGKLTPLGPVVDQELQGASLDEPGLRLFLSYNDRGYTRPVVLDAKTLAPIPLPPFPDALHVTVGPATYDDRLAAIRVVTATAPPSAYVYDWATGKLAAWALPSSPELDPSTFAVPTIQSFPAADGTPIPVVVTASAACTAPGRSAPCPVIVEFHGGPEGQSVPTFSARNQLFVDAGFVLVQPNVRGSTGYGRTWLDADNGPKRLEVISDLRDAGVWARSAFAVNGVAPKVGVCGGSYGGYATLAAMTMFGGTFDAGVSTVGIANLDSFLRNTAPYRRLLRITEYGDPDRDAAAIHELSPINHLDGVKGPLLILQGVDDPRVPVGEAIAMHEALVAKGLPSELMLFPGEGHGAQRRDGRVLMTGHLLAFFERQLGPTTAASGAAPAGPVPTP